MKIAIVGAGASGSTLVRKFIQASEVLNSLHIDVFEKRDQLVVGQPYEQDTTQAIMNEHAQDLSIQADQPSDFLDWLGDHYPELAFNDAFPPRTYYGEYLSDRLLPFFHRPQVNVIPESVIDLDWQGDKQGLLTDTGRWYQTYDAVFFTIGHPPYADRYQLSGTPGYINHPYPIQSVLNTLDPKARVGVIGSGLTSMDVIKYLLKEYDWQETPKLFIRDQNPFRTVKFKRFQGELQMTFAPEWITDQRNETGHIALDLMVETFRKDLADNGIDFKRLIHLYGKGSLAEVEKALQSPDLTLGQIRRYVVRLTQLLPDLYNALTPSDRDNYSRNYEAIFNHFRSQMPVESLKNVINALGEHSLELITDVQSIDYEDNIYHVKTKAGEKHLMDVLINCAGFQLDLKAASNFDLLLNNLYNKEIFTPYYRGGIAVTWPQCQVLSNKYGTMSNTFLLGHWISPIHYGNNNIHLCIKQAERVADDFIQNHKN